MGGREKRDLGREREGGGGARSSGEGEEKIPSWQLIRYG